MGMSSALYSGVSGLNTNSNAINVIGNNLANTNTLGYKGSRSIFSDLLSSNINGSGGSSQIGRGVGMSVVDQIFSQGTFENTESNLDVAIDGDSFFVVSEAGVEESLYTRAGAFRFNSDGYLVNPEGYRVQGKLFDEAGNLAAGDEGDLKVQDTGLVGGQATNKIDFVANLDSSDEAPAAAWVDNVNPATDTYNHSTAVQVYDSLGNSHLVHVYFVKQALAAAAPVTAQWQVKINYTPAGAANPTTINAGILNFNNNGEQLDATNNPGKVEFVTPALPWANGSADTPITLNFDTTQFNTNSRILSQDQNGYGAGSLNEVKIDENGILTAYYTNGDESKIGQLALARFANPNGLQLAGSNLYKKTQNSGEARVGIPGDEMGKVYTNSLEQSNVDMGSEMVRMITVQRGFQANSKVITTVDELLGELINIKR